MNTSSTSTTTVKQDIDTLLTDYLPVTAGSTKVMTGSIWMKTSDPLFTLKNSSVTAGSSTGGDIASFGSTLTTANSSDASSLYTIGGDVVRMIGDSNGKMF